MRFEQSYLASVRAFIHEVEREDAQDIKESRQEAKEDRQMHSSSHHASTSDDDPIVREVLDAGVQSTTKGRRRRTASQGSSPPYIMTSTSPQGEPELWLGRLRIEWWVALFFGSVCRVEDYLLTNVASHLATFPWPSTRLPLLYCTIRDQLLSPVVQGAIFGMGGLALGHVRSFLMARRQRMATRQP